MKKLNILLLTAIVLALGAGCRARGTPTSNVPTAIPTPTVATPLPTTTAGAATCRAVKSIFASLPALDVPAVTAQDWARGPADAPVTLIEYSDFQ